MSINLFRFFSIANQQTSCTKLRPQKGDKQKRKPVCDVLEGSVAPEQVSTPEPELLHRPLLTWLTKPSVVLHPEYSESAGETQVNASPPPGRPPPPEGGSYAPTAGLRLTSPARQQPDNSQVGVLVVTRLLQGLF